jgi:hypothetical protein
MARHRLGVRTTGITIATAGLEIRGGQYRPRRIVEIEILMAAATASVFGIGRPANMGSVAGGTVNPFLPEHPDDTALAQGIVLSGWTTAPTAPTSFLYRVNLPATLGARWCVSPRDLVIAPATLFNQIVIWNITGNGVADTNITVEDL